MAEGSRKILLELLQIPGNELCADCGAKDPAWASYNVGIFICQECAGIHRSLGAHISKVRSVYLDNWDNEQLQLMSSQGNIKAKQTYEQNVPVCYRRPTHSDPYVLREQWIHAKYERREFDDANRQTYLRPDKEGYLMKLGKDANKFLRRRFVLTEDKLKYYNKEDLKAAPKAVLHLDDTNVTLVPDKIGHQNGLQIMFDHNGHTRNIYVYADTACDIVDWFHAIRSAKLLRNRIARPGAEDEELIKLLTRDFLKEGWLSKTGPKQGAAYRRRWCSLDKRKLMYFDQPMDAFPKGEIFLGTKENGFSVCRGVSPGIKEPGFCFTLRTPERSFHFAAETEEEQKSWMDVLQSVLQVPMSPQDSSNLAHGNRKRSSILNVFSLR